MPNTQTASKMLLQWHLLPAVSLLFLPLCVSPQRFQVPRGEPLQSPCPSIFSYDGKRSDDRWYGVILVSVAESLSGLRLDIYLDRPAQLLGNWEGEVKSKDNVHFTIWNPNKKLYPGPPISVRIFVKFEETGAVPYVQSIRLNGREICPEPVSLQNRPSTSTSFNRPVNSESGHYTTPRPLYSGAGPEFESSRPNYPESKPDHVSSGPHHHHPEFEPEYSSSRPVYPQENSEYETPRPIYIQPGIEHTTSRPIYTQNRPEYTTSKTRYTEYTPDYTTSRTKYTEQRPEYTTSRTKYTEQRPDYTTSRTKYTEQRPEYTTSSRTRHTTPRPEYTTSRTRPTTYKPHTSSSRPIYPDYESEYTTRKTTRQPDEYTPRQTTSRLPDYFTRSTSRRTSTTTYRPHTRDTEFTTRRTPSPTRPTRSPTRNPEEYLSPTYEGCGRIPVDATPLITHGQKTARGQWPWHVALYQSKGPNLTYICGGSLVSQKSVITAAHCVTKTYSTRPVDPDTLLLYLGKYHLKLWSEGGVQSKQVDRIHIHPSYNSTSYHGDIAILILTSPVDFTFYVKPVCIWSKGEDIDDIVTRDGTVVGWGYDESGMVTEELMMAKMPVVAQQTCIWSKPEFFSRFTSNATYCAGFRNGTSVCNGDSGGGMVFPIGRKDNEIWYLRGIVSISVSEQDKRICNTKHYVVFTDVSKYADWIKHYLL